MIKGYDIICIGTTDWEAPWGSRQQLMARLSVNNRILYVEYQASFLHISLWIKKLKNRLKKVNENLFIYTPFPGIPFGYYFRGFNIINQKMLSSALNMVFKKIGFINPILWICAPCAVDLLGRIDSNMVIFHCIADFPNEKNIYLRKGNVASMEKALVKKSDIVLASTQNLYNRHKEINGNTFLFPSAVDTKLFSPVLTADSREPEDMAVLKRPRIGLAGYLDGDVLDVDLLCYIADQHPDWQLVLIGPMFRHVRRFDPLWKRNNVYFLAEKKNTEIPAYIKYLDVCIIPYMVNRYTDNVSSLKLYEYLAMGKPVVSTNFAELTRFEGMVRIAENKDGFIENIVLSLSEKDARLMRDRIEFAEKNSWEHRISAVSGLIEKERTRLQHVKK